MSPGFPTGAFAYSHGLEWVAGANTVRDRQSLSAWLVDLVEHGALRNDLVLLAEAWRATDTRDASRLAQAAELGLALQPTAERHLETVTQGNAFVAAIRDAWPCPAMTWLPTAWDGDVALPIAVGVATSGHGIPVEKALEAHALAFVSNLVSASIRLSVIGQTDGQRVIAGLLPRLLAHAAAAATQTLDDIGSFTPAADLASIRHETQYTRLFRS
jgi:urease accessory protein